MDLYLELTEFLEELKEYRVLLLDPESYKLPDAVTIKKYPFLEEYLPVKSEEQLKVELKEQLREELVRKSGALKGIIIKLTGREYATGALTGKFEIWGEAFNTTAFSSDETALAFCIDAVNEAIGRLESDINEGVRDKQGKKIGESSERPIESPLQIFDAMQFHPRVIEVSESLFKTGNYSSAIFEAYKAVHNYVQDKTGLTLDGVNLMEKVFNENKPILQLNELLTKSDKDEQKGFKYLFMGSQMGIRNPPAHENVKPEEQNKALEYLGIASLLMRRIDGSKLVKLNI